MANSIVACGLWQKHGGHNEKIIHTNKYIKKKTAEYNKKQKTDKTGHEQ